MASKIQVRRDTLSNWNANNPVLSSGEIAFVTDENKIKIGDGASAFTSLDYLEADAYLDSVVMGDDTTGNYVETLIASDGISISGEGVESASVTITNTGVLSLVGTNGEIDVSASSGNITLSLPTSITVDLVGSVTGNADTASTLATARSISLGGDVSGSASFDGGADITITATVADDSHDHTIANIDGLQTELSNLANSASASASAVASDLSEHEGLTTNVHGIADTSLLATKEYADNSASAAAAALVDSAPEALNTLNELAAALGDDANFSTTITNSLAEKLSITSASATYLTQTDAATLYDTIGSASAVASDLTDHENSTTNVHGITDTSELATKTYADNAGVTSLSGTESEINVSASSGAITISLPSTINADTTGNAATASTLETSRAISLGGDLSGSASFNGGSDITITAAVADDSHNHIISNVDGLQTALDAKLDSSSYTAADVLNKIKTVDGSTSGLDADLLDGQDGSHYLDWNNTTNKPDPTITLGGDASGSLTLTDLTGGTLTVTVADDSHNHIISNVDGLQTALDAKAPLDSPTLTGIPTAPTASASANSTQIATTAFVQTAVSNVIDGAPGALNTLNELAAALGDDANFASTVTNSLAEKQPLDADLSAIAGLSASATGFLVKDGENVWSVDNSNYLTGNETITVSGDATGSGSTSISLTLANSGVSASTYGSSSQIPVLAVDAKGRITSASVASVEGLPSQTNNGGKYLTTNGTVASWDTINLGTDTDGDYVARLSVSGEGLSVTGSGESASVTLSNTGVTSLSGTANEVEVSASSGSVTLSLPSTINANTTGSAATLTTARAISLGGDVSGSASFNGGSNITITATVADDSHNHVISNVDGLQTALDAKLDSSSYTAADVLTKIKTVDGTTSGLDADLLDGQHGSHYLDWTNTTNKPDPTITLGGDASGSLTLTDLAGGTLTVTIADDSHNHIISNVDGLQTALDAKAPLESPALSGTPTAPTASASANSTQIATTAFVQTAVSNLINGAPGALDTLDELAAALGDDANFATTITNSLAGKQPLDADLTAIAALAGTSGFLKKTAANTWSLDTNTYLTGNQTITLSGDVSGSGTTSITVTVADDSHNHIISNVDGLQTALDAKLDSTSYTAADVLAKILTVDGAGSGIDADLLDGQSSAYYRNVANMNAGTLAIARGGTNTTATPTGGGVAYGTGTAIAYTSAGVAGQVLTSNGTSAPTWAEASGGGEFSAFFLAGL